MTLARRLTDYTDPDSFASRLRRRRMGGLVSLVRDAYQRTGPVSILDLGGTGAYWRAFPREILEECQVSVTLLNLPDPEAQPVELPPRFRAVEGDACHLVAYEDRSVDIVHSNSVIEHVGDWTRMEAFASEVRRVGKAYFVQTPNFWFPVEPHALAPLFHWLPRPLRVWLLLHVGLGHLERQESVADAARVVGSIELLDRRMLRALFPDASVQTERFCRLPKSLIAIKTA
jgi:Methyltransferase domain